MNTANKLRLLGCAIILTFTVSTPHSSSAQSKGCSTGPEQCCGSVVEANSPLAQQVAAELGIKLSPSDNLVGISCNPIGVGIGNQCNTQPVCCTSILLGGVIDLGCAPVK